MKSITKTIIIASLVVLVAGCMNIFGSDDDDDSSGPSSSNPSTALSFDLSNASAVGAEEMNVSASNLTGSSLLSASNSSQSAFGLVKILADGSIEMAMQAPENVWLPNIQFIATSRSDADKDIFVSFDNEMWLGWDEEQQQEIVLSSFLHIEEDGTYYEVMQDSVGGRVLNNTWYGNDDYKPVTFDAAGNLYFVWEDWSGGDTVQVLYRYSPSTHQTTALTAQLSGYQYQSFSVDPSGSRLFVQGERASYSGTASSFFRMYPASDMTSPKTVYYSSAQDVWVRGYIMSPDGSSVVMNGNNIRGINGVLRANIISDSEITYDPLFDSNSDGFSPEYNEWYSDWEDKTYYTGLFDRVNYWDSYAVVSDGSELFYLRFGDAVTMSGTQSAGTTTTLDGSISRDYQMDDLTFISDINDATSAIGDSSLAWVDMTQAQKDSVVFGYTYRNWDGGTETCEFIQMSTALRDGLITAYNAGSSSTLYAWNTHWLDESGGIDAAAVEEYLQGYFVADIEFFYGVFTGADAWSAFKAAEPYTQQAIYGTNYDSEHFLSQNFITPGGADASTLRQFRTDNNLPWLNFQDMSSMFYDSLGNLWGVLGGGQWGGSSNLTPIRLLNASGNKNLAVNDALSSGDYKPVGFLVDGDYLYFRDAMLDADGFETGYHKMYRLNLTTPGAQPEDVLSGLGSSNGRIEIVDFSIGGGFMYFTAVEGIQLIGGKINTDTLEYTPFNSDYVIQNIEVY